MAAPARAHFVLGCLLMGTLAVGSCCVLFQVWMSAWGYESVRMVDASAADIDRLFPEYHRLVEATSSIDCVRERYRNQYLDMLTPDFEKGHESALTEAYLAYCEELGLCRTGGPKPLSDERRAVEDILREIFPAAASEAHEEVLQMISVKTEATVYRFFGCKDQEYRATWGGLCLISKSGRVLLVCWGGSSYGERTAKLKGETKGYPAVAPDE